LKLVFFQLSIKQIVSRGIHAVLMNELIMNSLGCTLSRKNTSFKFSSARGQKRNLLCFVYLSHHSAAEQLWPRENNNYSQQNKLAATKLYIPPLQIISAAYKKKLISSNQMIETWKL
jgi:hypothetical protein